MKTYKHFLTKICDIENVSVKELMALTGKSQSVVYSWLNLSKPDCFPSIESLGKILFRLGISFDDFINCRHPVYDNGESARIYYRYIYGYADQTYIGSDILDLPNADEVIKTYLFDRMRLNSMVNDYINGLEIDKQNFDMLCKALMPFVVSDIITDADQSVFDLNSSTLYDYKLGIDIIKEKEEKAVYDGVDFDMPMHQIFFPYANNVILLAAENNIGFIKDYLAIADESDKRFLLDDYMGICLSSPDYDKKNKIIKKLIEKDCIFFNGKEKKAEEKYRELMKKVLQIQ
jgi:transcriptional regulator with XRE-family HTH domain